ncbi:MAG: HEAT repeat domain-containing protein [Candidatus Omnitrophica bacterium]|nr:HEAT repeat domain-containing protein [Candidatus Omnitrophota bacterium]
MRNLVILSLLILGGLQPAYSEGHPDKVPDPSLLKGVTGLEAIQVPEGFEVTLAADSSLAPYPMCSCFDDRGRLFLTDSSGKDMNGEEMAATRECRIQCLVDVDQDGVFDKATTFVDKLSLPMGVQWYNGSLYVANPPEFIRLEDTDDDGVADVYEIIHQGWNVKNTASLHGPFFGPDGWMYLTHGRHGYKIETKEGETLEGLASRLWRCRPDGSGLERYCGGGFDNPVELTFLPSGEILGTMTYFTDPKNGQRDALMHWHDHGVYPKPNSVVDEMVRTGDLMPTMTKFARIAPAGLLQYQGTAFGEEYHGNLFTSQFNPHRIQRHILKRKGDTFETVDEDFLTSLDPDFFPTDVLEDADGSLLVVDTGAWYVDACPVSRVARPEIQGRVYRVRKIGAPKIDDPRGSQIAFSDLTPEKAVSYLSDKRPAVRKRAADRLVDLGVNSLPVLKQSLDVKNSTETRCSIVWAACRIAGDDSLEAIEKGLSDPNADVRTASARAASRLRAKPLLGNLIALLSDESLSVRREAATALGEIGDPKAVEPLIESATTLDHRFLDHATIYSLIQLGDKEPLMKALASNNPHRKRVAIAALEQAAPEELSGEIVAPMLGSEDAGLRKKALWVASHHPEWAGQLAGFFRSQLSNENLSSAEQDGLKEALLGFSTSPEIQEQFSKLLQGKDLAPERKEILLETISKSPLKELPETWVEALGKLTLDQEFNQTVRWAALRIIQSRGIESHDPGLREATMDEGEPEDYRVALLATVVSRHPELSDAEFKFLVSRLNPELDSTSRLTAAQVIGKSNLNQDQLLEIAKDQLGTADALLLPALSEAFAKGTDPEVGKALISGLLESEVRMNFLGNGKLDELMAGYPENVQQAAAPLHQRLLEEAAQREDKMKEFEPLIHGGDVGRGRRIFFGKTAACYTCHAVGEEGGVLGPDLTMIGAIRQGRDLLEAVLFPSASFVPDYEPYRLETQDGDVMTGVIGGQDADSILFRTGADAEVRVPREDILYLDPSPLSIMPEGLDTGLTREEMSDLLAFLQSLNGNSFLEPGHVAGK